MLRSHGRENPSFMEVPLHPGGDGQTRMLVRVPQCQSPHCSRLVGCKGVWPRSPSARQGAAPSPMHTCVHACTREHGGQAGHSWALHLDFGGSYWGGGHSSLCKPLGAQLQPYTPPWVCCCRWPFPERTLHLSGWDFCQPPFSPPQYFHLLKGGWLMFPPCCENGVLCPLWKYWEETPKMPWEIVGWEALTSPTEERSAPRGDWLRSCRWDEERGGSGAGEQAVFHFFLPSWWQEKGTTQSSHLGPGLEFTGVGGTASPRLPFGKLHARGKNFSFI